jgi:hypothetical protein
MKTILSIENRNAVLIRMATLLEQRPAQGINQQDLNNYSDDYGETFTSR